jgi:Xaa-Pro aminopeptidase
MLEYRSRQLQLCEKLGNGLAIIANHKKLSKILHRGYFFSEDNFYYLTGFSEPDSLLMLDINHKIRILFCQEKNSSQEIWDGEISGVKYNEKYFDEVYNIDLFAQILEIKLMALKPDTLFYNQGILGYDDIIVSIINKYNPKYLQDDLFLRDINHDIAQMRLLKDDQELKLLTKAAEISAMAHIECMSKIRNMHNELEVEAEFLAACYKFGQRYLAYNPICAFGINACTLHYNDNVHDFSAEHMILIDCGVKYYAYASDITRTYPVTGFFSKAQQAIYEIVLEANLKAIESIKLGNPYNLHGDVALRVIVQGLIDIGLLTGSIEDNILQKSYKEFYMHSIGHWLGLAVHDVGGYEDHVGVSRKLAAGMVFTVEPGIYIRPSANIPEQYWNIGVRIEDEIAIINNNITVLSSKAPKLINEMLYVINHGFIKFNNR